MGGVFEVKAAQHKVEGGAQVISPLPVLPVSDNGQHNLHYQIFDADNKPLKQTGYMLIPEGAQPQSGKTDDAGKTTQLITDHSKPHTTYIGTDALEDSEDEGHDG